MICGHAALTGEIRCGGIRILRDWIWGRVSCSACGGNVNARLPSIGKGWSPSTSDLHQLTAVSSQFEITYE